MFVCVCVVRGFEDEASLENLHSVFFCLITKRSLYVLDPFFWAGLASLISVHDHQETVTTSSSTLGWFSQSGSIRIVVLSHSKSTRTLKPYTETPG